MTRSDAPAGPPPAPSPRTVLAPPSSRIRAARVRRHSDGPRERLEARGAEALSDAELVALLLRTGSGRTDVLSLASCLLEERGGLRGLADATHRELCETHGIGPAKSASLRGALEMGRRLAARRLHPGEPLRGPEDVYRHLHARLRDARHEHFLAILLDGRHRVIREVAVSRGTLTARLVHPREVFRPALRDAAAALVLVHNHPSGDPSPSQEDRDVTRRLARAGQILGVQVVDHVVVAERGFTSLREEGLLDAAGPGSPEPGLG